MTTTSNILRSEFLNTQVITRNTGKRLGVVKDVLVDIDQREVVALGLRDSLISVSGMPRYMYLDSISQTGDVVLVEDEDVIEDVEIDAYSKLINSEVITESGEKLGCVRDFQFDLDNGKLASLIIASVGLPQIPDRVISTYSLPVEEIVSSGPNRIIVFEGSEERISQLTVGILEQMGIGRPPWEREEEDPYYTPTVQPTNQLGTGIPVNPAPKVETKATVVEETWDEDDNVEYVEAQPRQTAEAKRYQQRPYEDDNWGGNSDTYEQKAYVESEPVKKESSYDDIEADMWDDDVKSEPYKAPKVNFTEKTKTPEYEEETNY